MQRLPYSLGSFYDIDRRKDQRLGLGMRTQVPPKGFIWERQSKQAQEFGVTGPVVNIGKISVLTKALAEDLKSLTAVLNTNLN